MGADAASPMAGAPHWNSRLELAWTERKLRCQLVEGVNSGPAGAELESSCLQAAWSGIAYTRGRVGLRGTLSSTLVVARRESRPEDEAKYAIFAAG